MVFNFSSLNLILNCLQYMELHKIAVFVLLYTCKSPEEKYSQYTLVHFVQACFSSCVLQVQAAGKNSYSHTTGRSRQIMAYPSITSVSRCKNIFV